MKTSTSVTDVLVDVTPGITVFRQDGAWHWRGGPNTTQADVIKALVDQVARLDMKHGLLVEALEGLQADPSKITPLSKS